MVRHSHTDKKEEVKFETLSDMEVVADMRNYVEPAPQNPGNHIPYQG